MIHRLRLRNWRSYEDLDLRLDSGTTFVVAPNGVGKTSIVYGLAWGVFGQHSSVKSKECIRAGAESAQVQVDFVLPDGRQLNIIRTVKHQGAPTAIYDLDGTRLTESSALTEMERALGIELSVAGRLSMMLGGGHVAASDVLGLENHLHQAFGVTHLLSAAETAQSIARESERARALLRSTNRQRIEDRSALESEIAVLELELTQLNQRGVELRQARDAAAAQVSLVERHITIARQLEQYQQQRSRLTEMIETALGRVVVPISDESIVSELHAELNSIERAIAELTERAVMARSVVAAAEQAVGLLDDDHGICPICTRSLPSHERASALSAHRVQRQEALEEAGRHEVGLEAQQTRMQAVTRLLAQFEALQPPSIQAEDTDTPTRAEAESLYQKVSADLDEHNRSLGGVQSRLTALKAQIDSDDQIQQEERALRMAYRREAAATAGAKVLREAADHVITSRIEPMANEVRGRWKHLFTSNGLTFRPDGSITRMRDGEELGWDTLSGGERTWARIVTHLIVMATTSSLPFAWFDEPLEHLDLSTTSRCRGNTCYSHTKRKSATALGNHLRTRHRTATGRRH